MIEKIYEGSYKLNFEEDFAESIYLKTSIGDFRVVKIILGAFDSDGKEQIGYGGEIDIIDTEGLYKNGKEKKKIFQKIKNAIQEEFNEEATIEKENSCSSCIKEHLTLFVKTYTDPDTLENMKNKIINIFEEIK